jgi:hypothetical protein
VCLMVSSVGDPAPVTRRPRGHARIIRMADSDPAASIRQRFDLA